MLASCPAPHPIGLPRQHRPLPLTPPHEPPCATVRMHHAVTGDQEGHRVPAHGRPHRPHRIRSSDHYSQLPVADPVSERNIQQRTPYLYLEGRSGNPHTEGRMHPGRMVQVSDEFPQVVIHSRSEFPLRKHSPDRREAILPSISQVRMQKMTIRGCHGQDAKPRVCLTVCDDPTRM
jgi:hypothetical protein